MPKIRIPFGRVNDPTSLIAPWLHQSSNCCLHKKAAIVVANRRWILMRLINGISFRAQVREHVMTATRSAFVPQRRDIDGATTIRSPGPAKLPPATAVIIDHLAAARPRIRRIVFQTRSLVRRDDISDVFDCARRD